MDISRNFTAMFLASFVSIILFYSMHLLIKQEKVPIKISTPSILPQLLKMPKDISDQPVIKPPKPAQVQKQPESEPIVIDHNSQVIYEKTNIVIPEETVIIGANTGSHDHITIVPIAPSYPASLAQKCIEGSVITGFTITNTGSVIEPYIVSSSHKGFERSALRAIKKFKFKPKMVDGQPVTSLNARYKFSYKLDNC